MYSFVELRGDIEVRALFDFGEIVGFFAMINFEMLSLG
jgi:hypothetical protein